VRWLQQYDTGVPIAVLVEDAGGATIDLSGSATGFLLLEAPSGRRKRFAGTVDATAKTVTYVTQPLDLDEWGDWRLQAEVIASSFHVRTAVTPLQVRSNLDSPQLVLRPDPCILVLGAPVAQVAQTIETEGGGSGTLAPQSAMQRLSENWSAEADFSGGDWLTTDNDTSWLMLPVSRCPYPPGFQRLAVAEWDIGCAYFKALSGSVTFDVEFLVDDTPVGALLSFSSTDVVSTGGTPPNDILGKVIIEARLRCVHGGTPSYDLEVTLSIRDAAGVTLSSETKSASPVFDPYGDRDFRFRLRKTAGTGIYLGVRSHGARPVMLTDNG
jgi:hypothetical protein